MKETLNKLFLCLTILFFIFMAMLDLFPSIGISPKMAVIGVVLFGILTAATEYRPYTTATPKKRYRQSLIITHAILAVLLVLTLAGGESQSGISLSNPVIWLIYIFSILPLTYGTKNNRPRRNIIMKNRLSNNGQSVSFTR